ncbi:MAG: hypothetical protein U0X73_05290 [Thermoanaerobaculia bacterium]
MATGKGDPGILAIACELPAGERIARQESLLAGLVPLAATLEATADGYRLTFATSAGLVEKVVAAIAAERNCCRFFRFALDFEPNHGPIRLDVTGPAGTREFLTGLFAEAQARDSSPAHQET